MLQSQGQEVEAGNHAEYGQNAGNQFGESLGIFQAHGPPDLEEFGDEKIELLHKITPLILVGTPQRQYGMALWGSIYPCIDVSAIVLDGKKICLGDHKISQASILPCTQNPARFLSVQTNKTVAEP